MGIGEVIKSVRKAMTARELIEYDDLARKEITVEKWNGLRLLVVEMTGEERDRILDVATEGETTNQEIFTEQVVLACVKDPDTGLPFFDLESVRALKKKSWRAVEQVAGAVFEINGLSGSARAEMEKNSGGGIPSDGSTGSSVKS